MKVLSLVLVLLVALFTGHASGQVSDAEKHQFELIKTQAERGDAPAQLSLGSMYASGRGVNRDEAKAFKWHRKAAEQGLARAQLRLAYEYANGLGVKSDHLEAVRWLRRAADQKLADAEYQLGVCYAKGDGVSEDAVEAAKWYRKGAEQNFAEAQYELGNCYFEGNGITKDIAEGVTWTRKAAEQGFAAAQNSLGLCYSKGRGVTQNHLEAYKWFNLAAAQGSDSNVEAKMNLSMAERSMTPDQIAEGQRLAHDFKPHVTPEPGSPHNLGVLKTADGKDSTSVNLAQKTGMLTVKADDETYDVYLDGSFVGNAPAKLKLLPGSHVIEVKKPGFKDFRKELKVTEGSELSLRAVLERTQ